MFIVTEPLRLADIISELNNNRSLDENYKGYSLKAWQVVEVSHNIKTDVRMYRIIIQYERIGRV